MADLEDKVELEVVIDAERKLELTLTQEQTDRTIAVAVLNALATGATVKLSIPRNQDFFRVLASKMETGQHFWAVRPLLEMVADGKSVRGFEPGTDISYRLREIARAVAEDKENLGW